MKKVWIFTLCCSVIFAENSMNIEIFDASEEEIVIPASAAPEEEGMETLQLEATVLPDSPPVTLLEAEPVELSTEASISEAPSVAEQTLSIPAPSIIQQQQLSPEEEIAALEKEEQEVAEEVKSDGVIIDLGQVFAGSPTIYSVLFILSVVSVGIWSYALLSLRNSQLLPPQEMAELKNQLHAHSYEIALDTCNNTPSLLFGMVATAIKNRHQGSATMLELMKSEGRRLSIAYWQKINLLNEIAIIAPMLGLLGTVLGMFYAFYDLNRSAESISALFDGLGISVGTTVGGLVVAILALLFHSMTKYRLMKQLTLIEAEAEALAQTIQPRKE
jgi:biopolymer transport protein ExbB